MTYLVKYEPNINQHEEYLMATSQKVFEEYGHEGGPNSCMPDPDKYKELNDTKQGGMVMAYHEGKPVAFMSFFIGGHFHYQGQRFGMTDSCYIEKEHRSVKLYNRLVRTTESTMQYVFDIDYLAISINSNNNIGKLVQRLGYSLSDYVYTKKLGE